MPEGMQIYTNRHMVETKQIRFPKSKRKRIRKKWTKNRRDWGIAPMTGYLVVGDDRVYCHPVMAERLRRECMWMGAGPVRCGGESRAGEDFWESSGVLDSKEGVI